MKKIKKVIEFLLTITGIRFITKLIRFFFRLYTVFVEKIVLNKDLFGWFLFVGLFTPIIGWAFWTFEYKLIYTILFLISKSIFFSFAFGLIRRLYFFVKEHCEIKNYLKSLWN